MNSKSVKNKHRFTGELIDEYSYRYDSNSNIIEEIKREPYKKKASLLDIDKIEENDRTLRVTKQNFSYDDENKLTDARVERLGMKDLSEASVTTYHYEYDSNGNRTTVEIKDDGLTLESTVYTYDRLNRLVSSREVTANGLYIYEYTYDDNGNLIQEDRHRLYELNTNQWTNIRRYEYTKDNKLESVYSGNSLLVSYTYDGDGTITSSLERDLDLNQNLNIHDSNYMNSLTNNQRELINRVSTNDSFLYELTEYITDKNQTYTQTLMERDGTSQLSTIYTYGNQRINSESYNNLSGLYTYDGRGSVSAVIGSYGDFRAAYWYDGLGNVKSQIYGYGAFGSGKKYYGYNAEQYNPVTGNQNLRARQLNIRRQRFLTEDTFIGRKNDILSINRYVYAEGNPLKYIDPSGFDTFGIGLNVSGGMGVNTGTTFGTLRSDSINGWTGFVSPSIGGDTNMGAGFSLTIFHDNNNIESEKTSSTYSGGYISLLDFSIPVTIEYGKAKDDVTGKNTGWVFSIGLGGSVIPFGAKVNKSWIVVPDYNQKKKVRGIEFIPNTAIISPQSYRSDLTNTTKRLNEIEQLVNKLNDNVILCN